MNLEKFTQGEEVVEDARLARLIEHNATVRDHWQAVAALKESMQAEDYIALAEVWLHMPAEVRDTLWLAPTKGGIFTTKEREILKSNAAFEGRTQYQQEK